MARVYPDPFGPPWRFNWVRTLFTWEGGIFQLFWVEWLSSVLVCTLCITATYIGLRDNTRDDELPQSLFSLQEAASFVADRFQAAIGLMLGFYTFQCFGRWSQVRQVEGGLIRTINNLALQISWFLSHGPLLDFIEDGDSSDEEEKKKECMRGKEEILKQSNLSIGSIRMKLVRWLNLSHAIVIGELYETKDNDFCSLEKIRDNGLATELEYRALKGKRTDVRYVVPLVWYVDLLNTLEQKQLLGVDSGAVTALSGPILSIRGALEDLYQIRNTPIPLCYRQLTNFAVRCYVVILLVDACLSEVMKDDEYGVGRVSRGIFWFILVFAFEYFLFVGWLTVADALGNPFRCWSDEYDWERFVKALYVSSSQLASGLRDEQQSIRVSLTKETEEVGSETVLSERSSVWNDVSLLDPHIPKGLRGGVADTRRKLTGF